MVIQPKIKIVERGKLSTINEINRLKIETRAKQGQNDFALVTRESLRGKLPVFLACCGGSDETRTRDLRRDRASFHPMNKRSASKPQRFQSVMRPMEPFVSP